MTIRVTEDTLTAELSDGRTISAPLAWYPRLVHATPEERGNGELIGGKAQVPDGWAPASHVSLREENHRWKDWKSG